MTDQTPTGRRKQEMLAGLLTELESGRRRRTARRRATGALAAVALVATGVIVATLVAPTPVAPPPIAATGAPSIDIAIVRTDASAVASMVVRTDPEALARATAPDPRSTVLVQRIGDDELLAVLASAGRPTGLIRTGDRVILTEDVVEARRSE